MSVWSTVTLTQIAFVNPTEKLTKGKFVTKISMDNLRPYSKKIYSQSQEAYNAGMRDSAVLIPPWEGKTTQES